MSEEALDRETILKRRARFVLLALAAGLGAAVSNCSDSASSQACLSVGGAPPDAHSDTADAPIDTQADALDGKGGESG